MTRESTAALFSQRASFDVTLHRLREVVDARWLATAAPLGCNRQLLDLAPLEVRSLVEKNSRSLGGSCSLEHLSRHSCKMSDRCGC
jgi:hypothetical protein